MPVQQRCVLWRMLLIHIYATQLPSNCVTLSPAPSPSSASASAGFGGTDVEVGHLPTGVFGNVRSSLDNPDAATLSRGHVILLEKGLQIQAMAFPWTTRSTPGFSVGRFEESNFTGLSFWESPYPVNILGNLSSGMHPQWSRFTQDNASLILTPAELPYLDQMVNMQYFDEPGGANGPSFAETTLIARWLSAQRKRYPHVLSHTDIAGTASFQAHSAFVAAAKPDMVLSSWYPWSNDPGMPIVGGSPTTLYEKLQMWRHVAIAAVPTRIPYGIFTQTVRGGGHFRQPSESELRLNLFAAWTLGYTYTCAFLYSTSGDHALVSALFDGLGDDHPTESFYQLAQANSMGRKLGPTLVRLLSIDVRFVPGLHLDGDSIAENPMPGTTGYGPESRVLHWDAPGRPASHILLNVSVETMAPTMNSGLRGDVVVGFFAALPGHGPYNVSTQFMVLNGLTDKNATSDETVQRVRLEFVEDVYTIQRIDRESGEWEMLPTTLQSGGKREVAVTLPGGTADLFCVGQVGSQHMKSQMQ